MKRRPRALLAVAITLLPVAAFAIDHVLHTPVPAAAVQAHLRGAGAVAARTDGAAGALDAPRAAPPPPDTPAPANQAAPLGAAQAGVAAREPDVFRPDRDTSTPESTSYSDPFVPSVAPFARVRVFEHVDANYTLLEGQAARTQLPLQSPAADAQRFSARLQIALIDGEARLPTPGPHTQLIQSELRDGNGRAVPHRLERGAGDQWWLSSKAGGPLTLSWQAAVPMAAFGGPFGEPRWDQLPPAAELPLRARRSAERVLAAIGVSHRQSPHAAVAAMTHYFRSFQPSTAELPARGDIYLDLALSQRGVCRHRAFAFFITALALGVPTRMVVSEAHAWVEVHNGTLWQRIDLGGAVGELRAATAAPMRLPPDPFDWPPDADRGSDALARSGAPSQAAAQGGGERAAPTPTNAPGARGAGAADANGATTTAPRRTPPAEPEDEPAEAAPGEFDPAEAAAPAPSLPAAPPALAPEPLGAPIDERDARWIELELTTHRSPRGGVIHVRGVAKRNGALCPHAAITVRVRDRRTGVGQWSLGSLAADAQGRFEGDLPVPAALAVGHYEVLATASGGSAACHTEP